jgi:hypothetical protein
MIHCVFEGEDEKGVNDASSCPTGNDAACMPMRADAITGPGTGRQAGNLKRWNGDVTERFTRYSFFFTVSA